MTTPRGRSEIVSQWAKDNPEGAAAWAFELGGESEIAIDLRNRIVGSWATRAPAEAASFLVGRGIDDGNVALASKVLEKWMKTEPDTALLWSQSEAPATLPGALGALARDQPARAAESIDWLNSSNDRSRGIEQIASAWSASDPQASLEWLGNLPDGDSVDAELGEAAKAWVLRSPEEASIYIREMPAGERRDFAVAGMLEPLIFGDRHFSKDVEAAKEWVETISDEVVRRRWESLIQMEEGIFKF